ncbi:MAG TPA: glycosyltransferase [Candidatus Krumholzibacteria bacterium]|nr:glycosyltransferase [Candidatus Krumholzibacteria bacterium]
MRRAPTVSAVICFLDAERFLREAIRSVWAQTFTDWELLLVDDGSRDGGHEIAQEMLSQRPEQMRLLEHPGRENRGISASRNLALREARGRYVAFLDADDVWLPEKLERQVALLDAHPEIGMTYGRTQRWYGWTGKPGDAKRDLWYPNYVPDGTIVAAPDLLTLYLQSGGAAVPGICSLLARREAVMAVGGFDDHFRGIFEDQVFYARMCLQHAVLVTDDETTRYRQHETSCCAGAQQRGDYDPFLPNAGRRRYLHWLRDLVQERRCEDAVLWKALRRELRPYGHPLLSWPWFHFPRWRAQSKEALKELARRALPAPLLRWVKARLRRRAYVPPAGWVRFGDLRRREPMSRTFGYDRGLPVDRLYIERFLAAHAADVRGRALEVGDDTYTRRFGRERVQRRDVLHPSAGASGATVIADLARAEHLPADTFDCIVLTQTLQFIYDLPAAVRTLHRILKPGGVVLATVPGLTPLGDYEWTWCWSFTPHSARRLFTSVFAAGAVEVEAFGNVLTATAFLHGIAAEELRPEELEHHDPSYPLLITVRAVKEAEEGVAGSDAGGVAA